MTILTPHPTPRRLDELGELPFRREVARLLALFQRGRSVNWCGDLTLATAANTTTVADDRVTEHCEISLHPVDANAASILPRVWVKTLNPGTAYGADRFGSFVLEHPTVSETFAFRYSIKG